MNVTMGDGTTRPAGVGDVITFEIHPKPFADWAPKLMVSTKDVLVATFRPSLLAGRLAWLVIFAGIAVEAMLGARLWAQLTNQLIDTWLLRTVFNVTDVLMQPFLEFEPSQPIKLTGVLEFSTLVAMEVYLVAILGSLLALFLLSKLVGIGSFLIHLPVAKTAPPASEVAEANQAA